MDQLLLTDVLYVGQVIDAIIVKFKMDAAPQQLQLSKLGDDGSSRILLKPTQTLSEAGIIASTRLVVELTPTPSLVPLSGARWRKDWDFVAVVTSIRFEGFCHCADLCDCVNG